MSLQGLNKRRPGRNTQDDKFKRTYRARGEHGGHGTDQLEYGVPRILGGVHNA